MTNRVGLSKKSIDVLCFIYERNEGFCKRRQSKGGCFTERGMPETFVDAAHNFLCGRTLRLRLGLLNQDSSCSLCYQRRANYLWTIMSNKIGTGSMNIETIQKQIDEIRSKDDDDEAQHILQDELYEDFIDAIAEGTYEGNIELGATLVMTVKYIDFD